MMHKNLKALLLSAALCFGYSAQAQYNYRFDPDNTQVPSPATGTYNTPSIAHNGSILASVSSYFSATGTDEDYLLMGHNVSNLNPNTSLEQYTTQSAQQTGNALLYADNGIDLLVGGQRQYNIVQGNLDMSLVKYDASGNQIYSRWFGTSEHYEECMLVAYAGPGAYSVGSYLVVGVTDEPGTLCPYIALISDITSLNSCVVHWRKVFKSGHGVDEIPTSIFQESNGDWVVAGHTEGGYATSLFTFSFDNTGAPVGNWVNYDVGTTVDESNAFIQRSYSGAGGYVLSYTVGDASGSAVGMMEIDNSRSTVYWNTTYYEVNSDNNHGVAVYWTGSQYVLGTGHLQSASSSGFPGFLGLSISGSVNSFYRYATAGGDFARTQAMIPVGSDYAIKVLYNNLDGYGLIKTDATGSIAGTCVEPGSIETTVLPVQSEVSTCTSNDLGYTTWFTESMVNLNGVQYNCDGSTYATFLPNEGNHQDGFSNELEVPEPHLTATVTGTESVERKDLVVFPNPSNGSFQVNFGHSKVLRYDVTTLNGKILKTGTPTGNTASLDLQHAPAGVYLLKVQFADGQWIEKISIQ